MGVEVDKLEQEFIAKQKLICKNFNAGHLAAPFDKFIGVALESFVKFNMPINGLRHPAETVSAANWYTWLENIRMPMIFSTSTHSSSS